jgi:hypothetical protein
MTHTQALEYQRELKQLAPDLTTEIVDAGLREGGSYNLHFSRVLTTVEALAAQPILRRVLGLGEGEAESEQPAP